MRDWKNFKIKKKKKKGTHDVFHQERPRGVNLVAADSSRRHDAAVAIVVVAHDVAHPVRDIALAQPHRAEPSVERRRRVPDGLLQGGLQARRELLDELDGRLVRGDGGGDVSANDVEVPPARVVGPPSGLHVAQLLEVGARAQDVGSLDDAVVVVVVVAAENDVDDAVGLLGELVVVGLAHVGYGDDDFSPLSPQLGDKLLRRLRSGFVNKIRGKTVDRGQPFAFTEPY